MARSPGGRYGQRMQVIYRHLEAEGPPQPRDAREVRERLEHGNRRFSALASGGGTAESSSFVIEGDFSVKAVIGKESPQRPFGIVLGCADSRVPSELIFGCAVNDLFVVRLAGNTVSADALGSI